MDLRNQIGGFALRAPEQHLVIELRIDELILDGFDMRSGDRIGAALERELSRLISAGGFDHLAATPVQLDSLNAGSFHLEPNSNPRHVGRQIAERIYGGLASVQRPGVAHNTAEGGKASHA